MLGHVDLPSKIALATPTTGNLYAIILDTAVRILHVTEEFVPGDHCTGRYKSRWIAKNERWYLRKGFFSRVMRVWSWKSVCSFHDFVDA